MNLWSDRDWSPMLLEEVNAPFNSQDYIFEIKFDGIRATIFANSKELKIYSRNKQDITYLYPELDNIRYIVKGNTIFDGEIIVMQNGKPSFNKLQERIRLKDKKKIEQLVKNNPVIYVCFDILYDNKSLINLPLLKRKKILNKYEDNDCFLKSKYIEETGVNLFRNIQKADLEGIVAKKKDSIYEINRRSDSWVKIKNLKEELFFIGGFIEKKSNFVISLVLGEYKNNKLYYVGKVTLSKKSSLYNVLKKEKVMNKSVFCNYDEKLVNYLKPMLKCKVRYLERTKNNHLRHPTIYE